MAKLHRMTFDLVLRVSLFRDDIDVSRFLVSAIADASTDESNGIEPTWHYRAAMAALLIGRMRLRIEQMGELLYPSLYAGAQFDRVLQSEKIEQQVLDMYADDNIPVADSLAFNHGLARYASDCNLHELRLACLDAAEHIESGCELLNQMKSVLKSINRHRIKTGEYARLEG
ncbi:TPA: hypothetical protein G8O67_005045 [Salmonella enterica]|uniref:Uncharacterized protein n=1 Tax=Salmonella enterica TaxID=28901 RepID=A0A756I465_SALER|nr:hypothetical protein [Salmonella enterica]